MTPVDKDNVNELCEELRALLNAELAAGNTIILWIWTMTPPVFSCS